MGEQAGKLMVSSTVEQALARLYGQSDVTLVRAIADEAATLTDATDRMRLTLMGSNANPLFVPTTRPQSPLSANLGVL